MSGNSARPRDLERDRRVEALVLQFERNLRRSNERLMLQLERNAAQRMRALERVSARQTEHYKERSEQCMLAIRRILYPSLAEPEADQSVAQAI